MPKYRVRFYQTTAYDIEVEADSAVQAILSTDHIDNPHCEGLVEDCDFYSFERMAVEEVEDE